MMICCAPVLSVTNSVTVLPAFKSVVPVMVGVLSLVSAGTSTVMLGGVESTADVDAVTGSTADRSTDVEETTVVVSYPASAIVASPLRSMDTNPLFPLPAPVPASAVAPAAAASNAFVGSTPSRIFCCSCAISLDVELFTVTTSVAAVCGKS